MASLYEEKQNSKRCYYDHDNQVGFFLIFMKMFCFFHWSKLFFWSLFVSMKILHILGYSNVTIKIMRSINNECMKQMISIFSTGKFITKGWIILRVHPKCIQSILFLFSIIPKSLNSIWLKRKIFTGNI